MQALEQYARIAAGPPLFRTGDAARLTGGSLSGVSRLLAGMERQGLVSRVRHGTWSLKAPFHPWALIEEIVRPYPAYVSSLSALNYHGMLWQPVIGVHVVTAGRPREIAAGGEKYFVHRITPSLFTGFESEWNDALGQPMRVARPEKALFDAVYLVAASEKAIPSFPELECPAGFSADVLASYVGLIKHPGVRAITRQGLFGQGEPRHAIAATGIDPDGFLHAPHAAESFPPPPPKLWDVVSNGKGLGQRVRVNL